MPFSDHVYKPSYLHNGHHTYQQSYLSTNISIMSISNHANQPPCLSAIMHICHLIYWPSCLSVIMPISYHAYQQSYLLTIKPICHHANFTHYTTLMSYKSWLSQHRLTKLALPCSDIEKIATNLLTLHIASWFKLHCLVGPTYR